jgi:hypothetical protein
MVHLLHNALIGGLVNKRGGAVSTCKIKEIYKFDEKVRSSLRMTLAVMLVGCGLLQMLNTCAILPITKLVVLLISGGKLYGNWEQLH